MSSSKKPSSKLTKSGKSTPASKKKTSSKKEALGSGWQTVLLLLVSVLAGLWLMFW